MYRINKIEENDVFISERKRIMSVCYDQSIKKDFISTYRIFTYLLIADFQNNKINSELYCSYLATLNHTEPKSLFEPLPGSRYHKLVNATHTQANSKRNCASQFWTHFAPETIIVL